MTTSNSMTTLELLEKHPKATTLIKDWFFMRLLASMDLATDVPDDFKEMMRAQPIETSNIAKMIDGMPRLLFDFFDENQLYIEILINYQDKPFIFTYTVIVNGEVVSNPTKYDFRKGAELAAIELSFEKLEKEL